MSIIIIIPYRHKNNNCECLKDPPEVVNKGKLGVEGFEELEASLVIST